MTLHSFETVPKSSLDVKTKPLTVGLVGYGFIGEVHARAIKAANGAIK